MKKRMFVFVLCLAVVSPLPAQKKEEERIANSAKVLGELLAGDLSTQILECRRSDVFTFQGIVCWRVFGRCVNG